MRVSAVDDDITWLEMGFQLADEVVDGITGLDEKDDLAGFLKLGDKLFDRVCTLDICAWDKKKEG